MHIPHSAITEPSGATIRTPPGVRDKPDRWQKSRSHSRGSVCALCLRRAGVGGVEQERLFGRQPPAGTEPAIALSISSRSQGQPRALALTLPALLRSPALEYGNGRRYKNRKDERAVWARSRERERPRHLGTTAAVRPKRQVFAFGPAARHQCKRRIGSGRRQRQLLSGSSGSKRAKISSSDNPSALRSKIGNRCAEGSRT